MYDRIMLVEIGATWYSRVSRNLRPSADPSCQASAIKNLNLTESLFANECEPFFNSIDPKRIVGS